MQYALDESSAIAEDREQQFPALAQVVKPSAQRDRLAFMLADLSDGRHRRGGGIGFGLYFHNLCADLLPLELLKCLAHLFGDVLALDTVDLKQQRRRLW